MHVILWNLHSRSKQHTLKLPFFCSLLLAELIYNFINRINSSSCRLHIRPDQIMCTLHVEFVIAPFKKPRLTNLVHSQFLAEIVDIRALKSVPWCVMKKSALFFIIATSLCLSIILAGLSAGKVCPKSSFLCSSFTSAFTENTVITGAEPDTTFLLTTQPDLIYHKDFLSSIFHPPKHISWSPLKLKKCDSERSDNPVFLDARSLASPEWRVCSHYAALKIAVLSVYSAISRRSESHTRWG